MNIKTVDVYYSFKWSERYIEEFKSGHDVILVNPDIPDERKPKELRVQLIKMIMKDFFKRHENLLWNEVNNKDKLSDFVERFWHFDQITSLSRDSFCKAANKFLL